MDEEDEEEVKAFEEAFAGELIPSDVAEGGSSGSKDKDEERAKKERSKKLDSGKRKRVKAREQAASDEEDAGSVFAAAEDYAEAINGEAERMEENESDLGREKNANMKRMSRFEKVGLDGAARPRKKRRVKRR